MKCSDRHHNMNEDTRMVYMGIFFLIVQYCQKVWNNETMCAILNLLSNRYPATEGGVLMDFVISFLGAVTAGVACHYIIKWLDSRNNKDNK